jgi:hypothetical protein
MDRMKFERKTLEGKKAKSDCDQVRDNLLLRDILGPVVPTDREYNADTLKFGFSISGSEGCCPDFVLTEAIRALREFARLCKSPEEAVRQAKTDDAKDTLSKALSAAARLVKLTTPPLTVVLMRDDSIVFDCILTAEAHKIKAARDQLTPKHQPMLQAISGIIFYEVRPDGVATTSMGVISVTDPDLIRRIDERLGQPMDLLLDANEQVVRTKLMTLHSLKDGADEKHTDEPLLAAA